MRRIPLLLVSAVIAACATQPAATDTWRDASLQPRYLAGATVAVACEAPDLPLQNICRDQLAADVRARGGTAIFLPEGVGFPIDARAVPTAKATGAKAILVMAARPFAAESSPGLSIGLGGFGFGRNSAVGGGVSAPIGPSHVEVAWSVNGRVIDLASERVVWTSTRTGKPGNEPGAQVADLTAAVLDSAQQSGLF